MLLIQGITTDTLQRQTITIEDGTSFILTLYFRPMQLGWFIEELSYGDFLLNGTRISVSPNILHQYRNQIPFGLACFSAANREPSLQQDFASLACKLLVLTQAEVINYSEFLKGIAIP